jgi:hypothetical protein
MTITKPSPLARRAAVILAAAGASLALASTAHAGSVVLWACHGPEGQALESGPLMTNDSGTGFTTTYGGGCGAASVALADGGALATFEPAGSPPPAESAAGWRILVPTGTTLTAVGLERATLGFGTPLPGDALEYTASVPGETLESASPQSGPLAGGASFAASGDELDLQVACDAAPGSSCAEPDGPPGLQLSALALTVTDPDPPRAAVAGVESPVAGPLPLMLTATDDGLGLASATATLDGQAVASASFGGGSCAALASPDSAINLALGADCPSSVSAVPLTVSTANVPDGPHHLVVTVTDIAGNSTTAVDQTIDVLNHLTVPGSTAFLSVGTGGSSATPSGPGSHGVGASSGSSPATSSRPACASPRITAVLAGHPLRLSGQGVPVLWRYTRYLFTGRLTCVKNHKTVGAPDNTIADIQSVIATRVRVRVKSHGKTAIRTRIKDTIVDRTGVATYRGGIFRVLLHPWTTRTIDFSYGSRTSSTLVKIFVVVTPNARRRL